EQGLPGGPGELSFGHGVSCVGASWVWDHLAGSDQETLLFNTVRPLSCCGVFRGNYWLSPEGILSATASPPGMSARTAAFCAHWWRFCPPQSAGGIAQECSTAHVVVSRSMRFSQ